jgi:lysine-N-methylase
MMSLPIVVLSNHEKWDCHQCGICCRGSIISLSDDDTARIRGQNWNQQPEFRNVRTLVRIGFSSRYQLAHRPDGACVFLSESGMCMIHAKFGPDAKPTICQVFPLQLIPREKSAVLTVRRACPSAVLDRGQDVKGHLSFVNRKVRDGGLSAKPIHAPIFKVGETRAWATINCVLESVANLLHDERYPPVRRVVHVLQLAGLLQKAKTRSMTDESVSDLVRTLEPIVVEESRLFFQDRKAPSWLGQNLFRQAALEYARLHPDFRMRKGVFNRLQMMGTGWRVFRSKALPDMRPAFPNASFPDLERPLGSIDGAIDRTMARYLETQSASYLYAIAERGAWSIVESIRGLAMQFPLGLWLLRWVSHGREPTMDDMVKIIVALDRGQGFAALRGPLQRGRIATLGAQGELERLAVWYA